MIKLLSISLSSIPAERSVVLVVPAGSQVVSMAMNPKTGSVSIRVLEDTTNETDEMHHIYFFRVEDSIPDSLLGDGHGHLFTAGEYEVFGPLALKNKIVV